MNWKKYLKQLSLPESYVSVTLGFLVVIVAGLLLYNYLNKGTKTGSEQQAATETAKQENSANTFLPATHTVAQGESLWTIAEKYYKSGYNWVTIAKENKLSDPSTIEVGQKLSIPKAEIITVNNGVISETAVQKTKDYTVVRGDDLWHIAVRTYGDGYAWVKIASANNLANPNIIHTGNVFKLPN